MQNLKINRSRFQEKFWAVMLLAALFLSGCVSENAPVEPVSMEGLSIEKQGYLRQGLIELIPDHLLQPILPDNPTQADLGEDPYYQICMACHGNWGQGLTDEWRINGFKEDQYCWESKCHATNHPEQGFTFPETLPTPVLGLGAMASIPDARALYTVIIETMPWWDPGQLTSERSLNLTAYIMRARGELPEGIVLTVSNLSAFPLHAPAAKLVDEQAGGIQIVLGLSISMVAYILYVNKKDEDDLS